MQDQRHRREGRQFEAEVQGHEIGGHANCDHGSKGDKQECEKDVLPLLLLHIGKGVEGDRCIEDQDRRQGESSHVIQAEQG